MWPATLDTNNRITINNLLLRQNTSNLGFIGHLRNNSTQATANVAMNNLNGQWQHHRHHEFGLGGGV
jgi:hypothetical protein